MKEKKKSLVSELKELMEAFNALINRTDEDWEAWKEKVRKREK